MENFIVFYELLGATSIFNFFLANSANLDAVTWLTNAVSGEEKYPDDFSTLYQYWNEVRDELDSQIVVNQAITSELQGICTTANMESFTFSNAAYVEYI